MMDLLGHQHIRCQWVSLELFSFTVVEKQKLSIKTIILMLNFAVPGLEI